MSSPMPGTSRSCCQPRTNLPPQTSPTSADALFNNLDYAGQRSKTPIYGRVRNYYYHERQIGWLRFPVIGGPEDLVVMAAIKTIISSVKVIKRAYSIVTEIGE